MASSYSFRQTPVICHLSIYPRQEYLSRTGLSESLAEHSNSYKYDILVLMGISISDEHVSRDLAVFSSNNSLKEKVSERGTVQQGQAIN